MLQQVVNYIVRNGIHGNLNSIIVFHSITMLFVLPLRGSEAVANLNLIFEFQKVFPAGHVLLSNKYVT